MALVGLGGVVVPVAYAVRYATQVRPVSLENAFWNDLFANWLATSLGLLFGLPIALWLSSQADHLSRKRTAHLAAQQLADARGRLSAIAVAELNRAKTATSEVAAGRIEFFPISTTGLHALVNLSGVPDAFRPDTVVALSRVAHALDVMQRLGTQWIIARLQRQPGGAVEIDRLTHIVEAIAADAVVLIDGALMKLSLENQASQAEVTENV